MKIVKTFSHGRIIVWMKKGEEFPGTTLRARQGFYEVFSAQTIAIGSHPDILAQK